MPTDGSLNLGGISQGDRHTATPLNHDNANCIFELLRYNCSLLNAEIRLQRANLVSAIADDCFAFGQPSSRGSLRLSLGVRQGS